MHFLCLASAAACSLFFACSCTKAELTAEEREIAKMLKDAWILVDEIESPSTKAEILLEIGALQSELGNVIASKVCFRKAFALASKLPDAREREKSATYFPYQGRATSLHPDFMTAQATRWEMIRMVIIAQAASGQVNDAIRTADDLAFKDYAAAMKLIVQSAVRKGYLQEAFMAVDSIPNSQEQVRNDALLIIASYCNQRGDIPHLRAAADRIDGKMDDADLLYEKEIEAERLSNRQREIARRADRKSRVLEALAVAQAKVGVYDEAIATAQNIRVISQRNHALMEVAKIANEQGHYDEVTKIASNASSGSQPYSMLTERQFDGVLVQVVTAEAMSGRFDAALKETARIQFRPLRDEAYVEIAVAYAMRGDVEAALTNLKTGLADETRDDYHRNHSSRRVALAFLEADLPEQALAVGEDLESTSWKISVLESVAQFYIERSDSNSADDVIKQITELVHEEDAAGSNHHSRQRLGHILANLGHRDEAIQRYRQAYREQLGIPLTDRRDAMRFAEIAKAQLGLGDRDGAGRSFATAFDLSAKFPVESFVAQLWQDLAREQVSLEDDALLLSKAKGVASPLLRCRILLGIAQGMHARRAKPVVAIP